MKSIFILVIFLFIGIYSFNKCYISEKFTDTDDLKTIIYNIVQADINSLGILLSLVTQLKNGGLINNTHDIIIKGTLYSTNTLTFMSSNTSTWNIKCDSTNNLNFLSNTNSIIKFNPNGNVSAKTLNINIIKPKDDLLTIKGDVKIESNNNNIQINDTNISIKGTIASSDSLKLSSTSTNQINISTDNIIFTGNITPLTSSIVLQSNNKNKNITLNTDQITINSEVKFTDMVTFKNNDSKNNILHITKNNRIVNATLFRELPSFWTAYANGEYKCIVQSFSVANTTKSRDDVKSSSSDAELGILISYVLSQNSDKCVYQMYNGTLIPNAKIRYSTDNNTWSEWVATN
jgi:hypothetical protein